MTSMLDEKMKLVHETGLKVMDVLQASGLGAKGIRYTLESLLETFPTDEEIAKINSDKN